MGILITIEGGEFTGKTSVIIPALKALCEHFNIPCIASREPGGTPAGEKIRAEIFDKLKRGATALELAVLFNQARKIHLDEVIIPFLGAHKEHPCVVLLDRYLDSTRVYQGLEAGVPLADIRSLEKEYVGNFFPDLTMILHFPSQKFKHTFFTRKQFAQQESQDRDITVFDEDEIDKHIARQNHYLQCAHLAEEWQETRTFAHIDAAQHPHAVIQDAAQHALPFFTLIKPSLTPLHGERALITLRNHALWEKCHDIYQKQQLISVLAT